ncbi:MAG: glycosyl hydrolase [Anaerobacillus sp.]|uniref:glycosyl hydrolase n=1 Tax=Anaerobacillus sp. TaxID=1872506 RepID=UPI0039198A73
MNKKFRKKISLFLTMILVLTGLMPVFTPTYANETNNELIETEYLSFNFDEGLDGFEQEAPWAAAGTLVANTKHTSLFDGAIEIDAEFIDDGDSSNWTWQEVKVKRLLDDVDINRAVKLSFDIILPDEIPASHQFQATVGFSTPSGFVKPNENSNVFKKQDLEEYGEGYLSKTVTFDLFEHQEAADMVLSFIARDMDYKGSIYINNVTMTLAASNTSPSDDIALPEGVVAHFAFENDIIGWQDAGTWQAKFGSPALTHAANFGDGALQVNANIDELSGWQELKISKNVPKLGEASKVSYEIFLEADRLANYQNIELNPHVALDPGWAKFGDGEHAKAIKDYELVTISEKEYVKISVTNTLFGHQDKNVFTIAFVAKGILYTGPIYIDNVIFKKAEVREWGDPEILPVPQEKISTVGFNLDPVNLVDPNATAETVSLFKYLQNISGKHILFGHQHTTTQGVTFSGMDGTQSDVKNAVGEFPAVYGWDTLSIDGNEEPNSPEATAEVMKLAYERGGVITLSAHMPNFSSGSGDFYDTGRVIEHILPGGKDHDAYNEWLDRLAFFANELLLDDAGKKIPIIFRPYHEHNGAWFWWGAPHATEAEYVNIWRYTVEYLRDVKEVNNFLYAYSPNGFFDANPANYLDRYPGDEYVDVLGFDMYDRNFTESWMNQVVADSAMIVRLAEERGKIAAITEIGAMDNNNGVWPENNKNVDWWPELLKKIKEDPQASKMAWMLTWRNGALNHMWVPYRNHPTLGHNEMLNGFIEFYNDDYTAFNGRLQGVYDLQSSTVEKSEPFLYIVTPTHRKEVNGETTIRAGAYHQEVETITYSTGAEELEMVYNPLTKYYEAPWQPTAEQNGQSFDIKVTATFKEGTVIEKTALVTVYASIVVAEFTFDQNLDGFEHERPWTAAGTLEAELKYNELLAALEIEALFEDDGDATNWTWQEVKVKRDLGDVAIEKANQVSFDIVLQKDAPASHEFQPVIGFSTPSGFIKPNEGSIKLTLADFEEFEGDYLRKRVTFNLFDHEEATALVLSFVARDWNFDGSIFIDNVTFLNVAEKKAADPYIVDDFENYNGDTGLLRATYSNNGDPVTLTLSQDHKKNGSFGLEYSYKLGAAGYAGRQKPLGGIDWSGMEALQFWMKHERLNNHVTIQIQAGGVHFERNINVDQDFEGIVEIPFSDFAPASWESNQTAIFDDTRLNRVAQFAIYIGGSGSEGTIYFDDIRAVVIEESPTTPEQPGEGEENPTRPEQPGEGEENPTRPEQPGEGEENPTTPEQPGEGEENPTTPEQPGEGEENPTRPEQPGEDVENRPNPEQPGNGDKNQKDSGKLPDTSTNLFNLLLVGIMLLSIGLTVIFVKSRSKVIE